MDNRSPSYDTGQVTRWSVILRAQGEGPGSRKALDELVRRYNRTILAHIRAFGCPRDRTPEDVRTDFIASVLSDGSIRRLAPEHGSFRAWLRSSVQNFVAKNWRAWGTKKRGHAITDSVDPSGASLDQPNDVSPEDLCACAEALDVCEAAVAVHRTRVRDTDRFDRLLSFISGRQIEPSDRDVLAAQLGLSSNALCVAIHDLQHRHQRILIEVLADGLRLDPNDPRGRELVLAELRAMLATLANCRERLERRPVPTVTERARRPAGARTQSRP
jgi:DNA-directed RNA polymerase specialized sigma24 family protein